MGTEENIREDNTLHQPTPRRAVLEIAYEIMQFIQVMSQLLTSNTCFMASDIIQNYSEYFSSTLKYADQHPRDKVIAIFNINKQGNTMSFKFRTQYMKKTELCLRRP